MQSAMHVLYKNTRIQAPTIAAKQTRAVTFTGKAKLAPGLVCSTDPDLLSCSYPWYCIGNQRSENGFIKPPKLGRADRTAGDNPG